MDVDQVLWLGGGCGAGKTTMARRLAYRFDLRLYPVDAYGFAHEARATPTAQPLMTYLAGLDFRARHVTPTIEERVEHFVGYARERFGMITADLAALPDGPLVIVEGPSLLPELVAPMLPGTGRAVWLLPTAGFTASSLRARDEPKPTKDESESERAHRLRLRRDARLTALMGRDAVRFGLATIEVDGSMSLAATEKVLAKHFAPILRQGPRARDGAERASMRAAENAVANAQVAAFHAYLGDNAPVDLAQFPYACECSTLGCAVEVPMSPAAYRSAGRALGHQ